MDVLIRKLEHLLRVSQPSLMMQVIVEKNGLGGVIIHLNTEDQLFDKGIDSRGVKLEDVGGAYTPNTIFGIKGKFKGKLELGLPVDRVTLYNSGEFYKSFVVTTEQNGDIVINADPNKPNQNLFDRYGKDIVGLTKNNLDVVRNILKNHILKYIRTEYGKG